MILQKIYILKKNQHSFIHDQQEFYLNKGTITKI